MKKLIIFFLILSSLGVRGQVYQSMPQYGYGPVKRFDIDSSLTIPTTCGVPTLRTTLTKKAAVAYDSCNKRFYYYDPKLMVWDTIKGGGGGASQNLQQVTNVGNTTSNDIQFTNDADLILDTFSAVILSNGSRLQEGYINAGYGGNNGIALVCGLGYEYKWEGGRLFVMNNSGNQIRQARNMFNDIPTSSSDASKGYQVGSLWILDNGNTYECTNNTVGAAVWTLRPNAFDSTSLSNRINNKVDSITKRNDSVRYWKNGTAYFAFKDSVGSVSGFVPYTGATQDLDMGNHGVDASFFKVTGTQGNGHIDFKHQSGDATGQANSTKLYANSQGYLKWKNDNLFYSTLAMPQTADRVYTYQNKSYTLGDSADIAARLKISDTSAMLTSYLKKTDTLSLSNRINTKLNISDTTAMLTSYLRKADTLSLSNRINTKLNISDTAAMLTSYLKKADTLSLSNRINTKLNISDTTAMLTAYLRKTDTLSLSNRINEKLNINDFEDFVTLAQQAMGSTIKSIGLSTRNPSNVVVASGAISIGQCIGTAIYLPEAATITGVKWYQSTQGNYTANNENRIGLYTYSAGTLTLVASSANDGNLWKNASNTWNTTAFSSPYTASAGLYFIAGVYSASAATTGPQIGAGTARANSAMGTIDFTNSGRVNFTTTGNAILPTSITLSSTSNTAISYAFFLY